MRKLMLFCAAALLAACGGTNTDEGTAAPGGAGGSEGGEGGSGGSTVSQSSVPLLWTGSGNTPKLAIGWQVLLGDDFDFEEQLFTVDALDLSTLPLAELAPPTKLIPGWDGTFMYSQALILAVDDVDGDGLFSWDQGAIAPDLVVGVAAHHMLFYVAQDPLSADPPSVTPGWHLGTLDFCSTGAVVDVPLTSYIAITAIDDNDPQQHIMDICGDVPTGSATGSGVCSVDINSTDCATCEQDHLDSCLDVTCASEGTTLELCARNNGCIDATTGAWDEQCMFDACANVYWEFDDCLWACWDPYAACY